MKITFLTLLNSAQGLNAIFTHRFRAVRAFEMKNLSEQINELIGKYNEQRLALCNRHGKLNAENGNFDIRPDEIEEFNRAIEELHNTEVHFSFQPLKVTTLGDVQLSVVEIQQLDWLITK